jgi:FkbM family methyltransferase
MNSLLLKISKTLANAIPKQLRLKISIIISKLLWLRAEEVFYFRSGILKYEDEYISGEKFLKEIILKRLFAEHSIETPVLFDVGANTGDYSKNLREVYPCSKIYAFEPNPNAFQKLKNVAEPINVKCFNIGLGNKQQELEIYFPQNEKATQHASLNKQVLTNLHQESVESEKVEIQTLDYFCKVQNIKTINFLKIDTEGFEYMVMQGAENMINNDCIDIILFEFNEMNVYTKVFLKDFYDILSNYNIYRLDSNKLINLNVYKTENEIFKYQNIVAFNKRLNKVYERT